MTDAQTRTLQAVVNRIIPEDDDWPGGWDAGVGEYLTRLWQREPGTSIGIAVGLDGLTNFTGQSFDDQDAALKRVENEPWFQRLAAQCWEGFWADPSNGGNKERVAWTMIGFEVTA